MQGITKPIIFIAFFKLETWKTRVFRMNPFMWLQSIILTSFYLHSLVFIPLHLF